MQRASLSSNSSPDTIISKILGLLNIIGVTERDTAIGIAVPALLDDEGLPGDCPNLPGVEGLDLKGTLSSIADARPVEVVTDAAAAAVAEARLGAGRSVRRVLCVSIGTGVNAAFVADGEVLQVSGGCLGDAGHICVTPDGPPCLCGGHGCLEAIASGVGLSSAGRPFGFDSARDVVEAAMRGEINASEIVRNAGLALGRAISSWSVIFLPTLVTLAGGVATAGELLLTPAREELNRVGPSYIAPHVEVALSVLGAEAPLTGAGLMALQRARK